jgi:flagellar biosynthesis/type III secretory pathway M-ring protein FliF/YscJ
MAWTEFAESNQRRFDESAVRNLMIVLALVWAFSMLALVWMCKLCRKIALYERMRRRNKRAKEDEEEEQEEEERREEQEEDQYQDQDPDSLVLRRRPRRTVFTEQDAVPDDSGLRLRE